MKEIPAGVRRKMLLRSFLVQGSWNYETMIGTGFAFTLLPLLRFLHPTDLEARRSAMKRHAEIFNSHPYLATVAIGAVARLEVDGTPPEVTERFKSALRSSLGSLGDRLVWTAWRPATLLLGVLLLLAGTAWWLAVVVFLLVYNAFHLALRAWGLRRGVDHGIEVGKVLREAPLEAVIAWMGNAGALFCGAALVLAIGPGGGDFVPIASGLVAAAVGAWLGLSSRRMLAPAVGLAWIFAIVWGMMP
jgi:mannose PTS system EIID component